MPPKNKAWSPIFTSTFREHLLWWAKKDRSKINRERGFRSESISNRGVNKILDLVEVVCQQPFTGIGKPKPLKYIDSDLWSRQINLDHRLIYRIQGNRIYFLQCRYHYD